MDNLRIGVDYEKETRAYRGVVLCMGDKELFRCHTGAFEFEADYITVLNRAMKIREGRIICLCDSIFDYQELTRYKRTKFPPKKKRI